ncbi:hypothetical protein IIC38_16400 [candidate division KSB1 bacterium]|nr:hypothetical protein [candidate division KSB1 bacterium]
MSEETVYYRRNLPHLHPRDKNYFITFRLAGSLPVDVSQIFKAEQEAYIKYLRRKFDKKNSILRNTNWRNVTSRNLMTGWISVPQVHNG